MYETCRHIMPSGLRCQSPAMRGSAFCYSHGRRIPPQGKRPSAAHRIDMPATLDRDGIARAIHSILQGLAADRISARRASILLLGLQMAAEHSTGTSPALDLLPAGLLCTAPEPGDEAIAAFNALAGKLGLGFGAKPPSAVTPKG